MAAVELRRPGAVTSQARCSVEAAAVAKAEATKEVVTANKAMEVVATAKATEEVMNGCARSNEG